MPLTDAKIQSLKSKDRSYKISDFGGLYVEVRPTGSKLWRLKYRIAGREKRLSFGAYLFWVVLRITVNPLGKLLNWLAQEFDFKPPISEEDV